VDAPGSELESDQEQRERLQRVHANEVRDAQVAADRAPAKDRQPRTTIGEANGVRASDTLEVVELIRGRPGHQERKSHTHECNDRSPSDRKRAGRVTESVAEQDHTDDKRRDPQRRDRGCHDRPEHGRERR